MPYYYSRRQRRHADPADFRDPLQDYSAKPFEDQLEEDLNEMTVADLETWSPLIVRPDDTVETCVNLMVERDFGCVLVVEGEDGKGPLIGIFSERDVLNKIASDYDRLKHLPVTVVMTHDPMRVYITDPPAKALNAMAVGSLRHVPILSVDDHVIGVLGPRRVSAFLMRYFPE